MDSLADTIDPCLMATGKGAEKALFTMIRVIDAHFKAGKFQEVADYLDSLNFDKVSPDVMVAFLSFTYTATRQLGEARVRLVEKVKPLIAAALGQERTDNIMSRLG